MKFTDRTIRALSPKAERYEAWEDNGKGLGIRISTTGRKTWIFMYRFQNKPRRMTFGTFPDVSLASAHEKHAQARQLLEQGVDPGATKQDQLTAIKGSPTVTELANLYIEQYARPRKRSWKEDQRILNKDVLPVIGHFKVSDVKKGIIVTTLDKVQQRGSPIAANRTLAVIRKMFNYALGRDLLQANPCQGIPQPAQESQRDRVLSEPEIRTLWNGLNTAGMTEGSRLALKFQLATAQRKGEIISSEWTELDLQNRIWTIPEGKSKNGHSHRVPLSDLAMDLIKQIQRISGDGRWLFPSSKAGTHVVETSIDHALRKSLPKMALENITPHDLRRTAASLMTGIGINRLVVGKILNHVEPGVTAVYDRHGYDIEKRNALNAWGAKLQAILATKSD